MLLPKWYEPLEEETPVEQKSFDPDESSRMAMKAALIEVTASRGWVYVEKFAETVVRDLERKAQDEDDDVKATGLRRDARGARQFKDELFRRVLMARNTEKDNGFVEVVTD